MKNFDEETFINNVALGTDPLTSAASAINDKPEKPSKPGVGPRFFTWLIVFYIVILCILILYLILG